VRPTNWAKLASRPGGRFANVKLRCPSDNKTSSSPAISAAAPVRQRLRGELDVHNRALSFICFFSPVSFNCLLPSCRDAPIARACNPLPARRLPTVHQLHLQLPLFSQHTPQTHIHRLSESSLTRGSTGRDFPPYALDQGCACAYPQRPFPSGETFHNTTISLPPHCLATSANTPKLYSPCASAEASLRSARDFGSRHSISWL
jgi:hypothetical protein